MAFNQRTRAGGITGLARRKLSPHLDFPAETVQSFDLGVRRVTGKFIPGFSNRKLIEEDFARAIAFDPRVAASAEPLSLDVRGGM